MRKINSAGWLFLLLLYHLCPCAMGRVEASMNGDASDFTSLFPSSDKLRHERLEVDLKQKVKLSRWVSTKIEGRGRLDLAVADSRLAPYHNVSNAVRDDELTEAEFREFYLNDLEDTYQLRMGLQKIDWVESLSPYASDILTPIDLRYGGFGEFDETIVPVLALDLNHKVGIGTLDWLFVPLPRTDRLPVGDNGYGYYPYLGSLVAPLKADIAESPIPRVPDQVEGGVRYLISSDDLDLTFLFYHGHERSPSILATPVSATDISLLQYYPQVNTAGAFATYSQNAWVMRALLLVQPSLGSAFTAAPDNSQDRLIRGGLGFDYDFSKDLKLYSEWLVTQRETTLTHLGATSSSGQMDYMATVRATNETLRHLLFSLTMTYTFPHVSFLISPEANWTVADNCKLALGAYVVQSESAQADFEMLKSATQAYVRFEYFFDVW